MTHRLRLVAAATLTIPTLVSLSACGFSPATNRVYTPAAGVSNRQGSVDVLDAVIVSADKGSGQLVAGLVNNSHARSDQLTSVQGSATDATISVSQVQPITLQPNSLRQLLDVQPIVVTGDQVQQGRFVKVTLGFSHGDAATLDVPVVAPRDEFAGITPPPAPTGSATPGG